MLALALISLPPFTAVVEAAGTEEVSSLVTLKMEMANDEWLLALENSGQGRCEIFVFPTKEPFPCVKIEISIGKSPYEMLESRLWEITYHAFVILRRESLPSGKQRTWKLPAANSFVFDGTPKEMLELRRLLERGPQVNIAAAIRVDAGGKNGWVRSKPVQIDGTVVKEWVSKIEAPGH